MPLPLPTQAWGLPLPAGAYQSIGAAKLFLALVKPTRWPLKSSQDITTNIVTLSPIAAMLAESAMSMYRVTSPANRRVGRPFCEFGARLGATAVLSWIA